MDLPTPKFSHSQYLFLTHEKSTMEGATRGFADSFSNDPFNRPLHNISTTTTTTTTSSSMEVRSDMLNFSAQRKKQEKKIEAPSTPGRPGFSFSVAKKGFPLKWDDAEKWLSNGSHESPAHPIKPSHSSSSASIEVARVSVQSHVFRQQMDEFAEKCRVSSNQKVPSFTDSVAFEFRQQQKKLNPTRGHSGASPSGDVFLKDKFTKEVESVYTQTKYSEPSKEGFMFKNSASQDASTKVVLDVQHRDIGTEMTPLGSSCPTPFKSLSPARHNTPTDRSGPLAMSDPSSNNSISSSDISQFQKCHLAKLQLGSQYNYSMVSNWSSRQEEEEEVSKSLRHFDNGFRMSYSETRTAALEEEEKTKCCLRHQREEAKIQAWVNLQNAKAEAQSRKLEVKIEKMRSNFEEKLMKRMTAVHRKAEEWRAAAQLQHSAQTKKSSDCKLLNSHPHFATHKSSCGCFPCHDSNLYL
ncbi:unnamed protein product [Rhodiola kirilowii]